MRDRIQYGFRRESVSDRLLELIAVWSNGDARIALQTLRVAAMSADNKKRDQITLEDLKEAFKAARKSKREYLKSKLNEHQRFLLQVIENRMQVRSGELFELYQKSVSQPLGERAYRNQMEQLVHMGLIKEIANGRWREYVTVA